MTFFGRSEGIDLSLNRQEVIVESLFEAFVDKMLWFGVLAISVGMYIFVFRIYYLLSRDERADYSPDEMFWFNTSGVATFCLGCWCAIYALEWLSPLQRGDLIRSLTYITFIALNGVFCICTYLGRSRKMDAYHKRVTRRRSTERGTTHDDS